MYYVEDNERVGVKEYLHGNSYREVCKAFHVYDDKAVTM